MRHRTLAGILPLALFLGAVAGCGSGSDPSPTGPGGGLDLASHFSEDEAVVTEGDSSINLRLVGVEFGSGSAEFTAASQATLDKFRDVFEHYDGAHFDVEAHTDERGTAAYNLDLSQRRAEAVRAYLVDEVGGPVSAIEATGFGETRPLDPGSSVAAWAKNRRVEVVIHPENRE